MSPLPVPEPVPVVGEAKLSELAHGRGAEELIPIDTRRRGGKFGSATDRLTALVAEALGEIDLADGTLEE